ncbi:MAG: TlpA disulfide reductase family protein, partial [Planctomycetales bacterium]
MQTVFHRALLICGILTLGFSLAAEDKAAPKAEEKKPAAEAAATEKAKAGAKPAEKKEDGKKDAEKKEGEKKEPAKKDEKPADKEKKSQEPGFAKLIEEHTIATFKAVDEYVKNHPQAPDIDQAYFWLFQNGLALKKEADVLQYAEAYLARDEVSPQLKQIAYQVQAVGNLKQKKYPQAVHAYEHLLESNERRNANQVVEFGFGLANKIQVGGDIATARTVFEKISDAFPLNEDLGKLIKRKLDRLDLVGQPPPSLAKGKDWEGKSLNMEAYKGKVVLIDFWATNCPPCLAELPN